MLTEFKNAFKTLPARAKLLAYWLTDSLPICKEAADDTVTLFVNADCDDHDPCVIVYNREGLAVTSYGSYGEISELGVLDETYVSATIKSAVELSAVMTDIRGDMSDQEWDELRSSVFDYIAQVLRDNHLPMCFIRSSESGITFEKINDTAMNVNHSYSGEEDGSTIDTKVLSINATDTACTITIEGSDWKSYHGDALVAAALYLNSVGIDIVDIKANFKSYRGEDIIPSIVKFVCGIYNYGEYYGHSWRMDTSVASRMFAADFKLGWLEWTGKVGLYLPTPVE